MSASGVKIFLIAVGIFLHGVSGIGSPTLSPTIPQPTFGEAEVIIPDTLSCYTGVLGLGSGLSTVSPFQPVGATQQNSSCASFCFECSAEDNEKTGCYIGESYTWYKLVNQTGAAEMIKLPQRFKNLQLCSNDNCNVPRAGGVCTLSCYTGVQGVQTVSTFQPLGASPLNNSCVSYCFACSANDSLLTGCTVGSSYTWYKLSSNTRVSQMLKSPAVYRNLKTCLSDNCNKPTEEGSCSAVATVGPTPIACYTGVAGVQNISDPSLFEPLGGNSNNSVCASFCFECTALNATSTGCIVGRRYTWYEDVSIGDLLAMQNQPDIYMNLMSCSETGCNRPYANGLCQVPEKTSGGSGEGSSGNELSESDSVIVIVFVAIAFGICALGIKAHWAKTKAKNDSPLANQATGEGSETDQDIIPSSSELGRESVSGGGHRGVRGVRGGAQLHKQEDGSSLPRHQNAATLSADDAIATARL